MKTSASLVQRSALALLLLLAVACGGGSLNSVENRVVLRLDRNGATTTVLKPNTIYTVKLHVTSPDASLHFIVTFDYDTAHFEDIPPIEVFMPKGPTPTDFEFQITTKSTPAAGEITMDIDAPADVTVQPLVYTIEP